jgi:uncharacterized protein YkwD
MTRKIIVLALFVSLFVPALRHVEAAPRRLDISPLAERIFTLINVQRVAAGLRPVTVNAMLMAEAQRFSGIQADLGTLSHRGNDGTNAGQRLTRAGYNWRFYGENLAAGHITADDVVTAWMNSPSHRAIMLHPRAQEIGIGHTHRDNDPARYVNYYAMEVGQPR